MKRKHRDDPRVHPTGLDAPRAPADVACAGPHLPFLIIEGSHPRTVELRACFRALLDSRQVLRKPSLGCRERHVVGRSHRLPQAQRGEIDGVQRVRDRVGVGLLKWCLSVAVRIVALGRVRSIRAAPAFVWQTTPNGTMRKTEK